MTTWLYTAVALSSYCEIVARLVILVVAQDESKVIGSFFVKGNDALVEVGMQDWQSHTWLTVGFHIPVARLSPVLVVSPEVDFLMATEGNAVHIRTEYFVTVNQ